MNRDDGTTLEALAGKLRVLRGSVAQAATARFFERHPDWFHRFGAKAELHTLQDATYCMDFLAAAVEAQSPGAFSQQIGWTARVLRSRGIDTSAVREQLQHMEGALAAALPHEELDVLCGYFHAGHAACLAPKEDCFRPTRQRDPVLERFVGLILGGDREGALGLINEMLDAGRAVPDVYADLIQEALYEVGRRWEANRISVAEEHMATAIVQFILARIYPRIERGSTRRGRMVITGVENELHQVGPNMIADVLEADGWNVRFLGTNTPIEGVIKAVDVHRADVLGISATMLTSVQAAFRLVRRLRESLGPRAPKVILGGSAFVTPSTLQTRLGAVGVGQDVRSTLTLTRAL